MPPRGGDLLALVCPPRPAGSMARPAAAATAADATHVDCSVRGRSTLVGNKR